MRLNRILAPLIVSTMLVAPLATAQDLKGFRLKAGDQILQIDPGETVDITLPDGSKIAVMLERNEFVTYAGNSFSFIHPTTLNVARSNVGNNIMQHLMASALGTLVIVQEYSSLNPASLTDLMMQELTKETVAAGGTRKDEPVERKLAGGELLSGLKASVVIDGETAFYEVLTYGAGNAGIVAVTRIDEERLPTEGEVLSTFWDRLDLK